MSEWAPHIEDRSGPRYLAIADAIAEAIENGELQPGDQLPTHRDLAAVLGVTVGTVTRGYAEAKRRGITVGEVGRGTFIKAPQSVFATWTVHSAGSGARPGEAFNLSYSVMEVGEKTEHTLLASTLQRIAQEPDLAPLIAGYGGVDGLTPHRQAGAAWIRPRLAHAEAASTVLTAGAQHAMVAALAAVARPGDTVLCGALTYPGIKAATQMLGLTLHGVAMDEHGVVPAALEHAVATLSPAAAYLVPTIHNPTAHTMPASRRQEVASVLAGTDTVLLEDDAHGLLDPDAPLPLATLLPEQTAYLATTSKVLAPGLRIGYVHVPERYLARVQAAIRGTTWMPSPLMAEVACRWITDGAAQDLLVQRRAEAVARQSLAARVFTGHTLWAQPHAYYVWLFLPEPWRREEFVRAALQRGVRIVGAEVFAVGRQQLPHAVRIGVGTVQRREDLERALQIVADLLADGGDRFCSVV